MKKLLTRIFEYFFEVIEVDEDGHEIKKTTRILILVVIFLNVPIFYLK